MASPSAVSRFEREKLTGIADWLAVALVVSLPWSTSATGILAVLWLLAVLPTLDIAALRREPMVAAGALPVLLWALGLVGMLWADVTWPERFGGLGSFFKLLYIPLLMIHFRRSERGACVIGGFLISCTILLALSWLLFAFPNLNWRQDTLPGIPVKNYASQADLFTICIVVLADFACR